MLKKRPEHPPHPDGHLTSRFSTIDEEEAFHEVSGAFTGTLPTVRRTQAAVVDDATPQNHERWDWRKRATSRIPPSQRDRTHVRREKPGFSSLKEGEPFHDEVKKYNSHFLPAIDAELLESHTELNERLSTWPLKRLEEEGYCITGMRAYWQDLKTFGRPTAVWSLGPGHQLPQHKFDKGTTVIVSQTHPLQREVFRGSVVSVGASQLRVNFKERFELSGEDGTGLWRLDVGKTDIMFERMKAAMDCLHINPEAHERTSSRPGYQTTLQGTYLRDIILKSFAPGAGKMSEKDKELARASLGKGAFDGDQRIRSWVERHSLPTPITMEGDFPLVGNGSQIKAMASMIGNRISLVQGPPGTGKTRTIIETIRLLKEHFQVPHPLLVCTYTNVAVDNLVEGLAAANLKPLRVGYTGSVRKTLVPHTVAAKLEAHPLHPQLLEAQKESERLKASINKLQVAIADLETQLKRAGPTSVKRLGERHRKMCISFNIQKKQRAAADANIFKLEKRMMKDITDDADVICTTCITSATSKLDVVDFPVVFIDEASMATEPVSLIPLMKGAKHVAFIGDHKQLPPVIVSKEAQKLGLGVSLFERLTQEGIVPSVMLDIQYRMHPAISSFPSNEFYKGTLRDGTIDAEGNVSERLSPPKSGYLDLKLENLAGFEMDAEGVAEAVVSADSTSTSTATLDVAEGLKDEEAGKRSSVVFLHHEGYETMKDKSRVNPSEAHIIASVVVDLLLSNPELQGKDIGIIAPYAAQITLLQRMFNVDAKYTAHFREVLGDTLFMQLAQIEIKTVDGFEGREKEVIIFSTVRNNTTGNIGFLADKRRLNVGLTRAKRALFVVGNINTLERSKISGGVALSEEGDGEGESVVPAEKGRGVMRVGKGSESWRRYAAFLTENGLVVRVKGDIMKDTAGGMMQNLLKRRSTVVDN